LRLVGLLVRGEQRLVQATFWIFVYIWFGLAALAQTVEQQFPIAQQHFSDRHQAQALVAVLVGLAAYEVGLATRHRVRRPLAIAQWCDRRTLNGRRISLLAVFGLCAVGVAVVFLGLDVILSSRATLTEALLGTSAPTARPDQVTNKAVGLLQAALLWAPVFAALYFVIITRRSSSEFSAPSQQVRVHYSGLLLVLLLIGNMVANNPIGNPRYRVGSVLFALAVASWPLRTAYRFRVAVLGLLVGILLVFPFADIFRYDTASLEIAPLKDELVSSPDFGMFQQEVNAQLYVDTQGHTFGEQLAGAAFVFVPRSLWPGKPIDTGNLIVRTQQINASASLWATVFVDGGWLAVCFVFVAYGRITGRFEDLFLRDPKGLSLVAAAVPLFAAFQIFLLRGDLQPAVGELALLPILLFFVTRRQSARHHAKGLTDQPSIDRPTLLPRFTAVGKPF
jgi:hypothetical protein